MNEYKILRMKDHKIKLIESKLTLSFLLGNILNSAVCYSLVAVGHLDLSLTLSLVLKRVKTRTSSQQKKVDARTQDVSIVCATLGPPPTFPSCPGMTTPVSKKSPARDTRGKINYKKKSDSAACCLPRRWTRNLPKHERTINVGPDGRADGSSGTICCSRHTTSQI